MAILKVLKCSECTRPLKEGQTKCSCGAINKFVQADVNPLKMTNKMAQEYIAVFKQQTEENPKDTNALFAMGLFYLGLKNYELAQRNFKMAVDLQPTEPDMYYYYALSLFEGKAPKTLDANKAEKIEEWLHTATNIQGKRKYLILQLFLRQGAFLSNGLQIHGETPDELLMKIQTMMPEPDELGEMTEHVHLTDPKNLEYLKIIRGEKQLEAKSHTEHFDYLDSFDCSLASDRDGDFTQTDDLNGFFDEMQNPVMREEFFSNLYEPNPPQKIEKLGYPIGNMLKRFLIMLGVTFVFFIIEGIVSYSTTTFEPRDPNQTVLQEFKELYGKKKLSSKERREKIAELRADSIENAIKDSAYFADNFIVAYSISDPNDENKEINKFCWFSIPEDETERVIEYGGIKKSYCAFLTLLFLLLPLIVFVLKTIIRFGRVAKERRQVDEQNRANQMEYERRLNCFHTRPTELDYTVFCREYLSKSDIIVPFGDPVTQTLEEVGIHDEKDMPAKILFVNYFVQYDKNDPNRVYTSDPYHVLDRVYYVVAVPQRDCLILNWSYWNTYENELQPCDTTTIYYNNINTISREGNRIVIEMNGTRKEIHLGEFCSNLLTYQADNPADETTFSLTRTGHPNEFISAVNQLINAFHNKK